jgi:large subunit ribosomal protein L29
MKIKELKEKSEKELNKMIDENREKLRKLKFDLSSGKVKNVREIRTIRKDIAKMFTLINKK